MPTLKFSSFKSATDGSTLVSDAFTPAAGDVIVVTRSTWDTSVSMGLPTGGSQTYTDWQTVAPGGFNCWTASATAKVAGTPGSMTVSSTVSASSYHAMGVTVWGNADLATTPNTLITTSGTASAPASLITASANSVVVMCSADDASKAPPATYLGTSTQVGVLDGSGGTNTVQYHWYTTEGAAGTPTVGQSAPLLQTWVFSGVEVLDAAPAAVVSPQLTLVRTPFISPWSGPGPWKGTGFSLADSTAADPAAGAFRLAAFSEQAAIGVTAADTSGIALRLSQFTETAAIGVTVADTVLGAMEFGKQTEPAPAIGVSLTDAAPGVLRFGTFTETAAIGLVKVDGSDQALRLGAFIESPAIGVTTPADVTGAIRFGATTGELAQNSTITTADTQSGLRIAGFTETVAIGLVLADTAAGALRINTRVETAAFGVVLSDTLAQALRLGGFTEVASIGVVVADPAAGALRLVSAGTESPSVGVTLVDTNAGVIRVGKLTETFVSGMALVDPAAGVLRLGTFTETATGGVTAITNGFVLTVRLRSSNFIVRPRPSGFTITPLED